MKVNDSKSEVTIVTTGTRSKSRKSTIRAKQTSIKMDGTSIDATSSVKYLGTKQRDGSTMVEEVTHRIQGGSASHARLVRRAFKGQFSVKLRVRLWCSLVRSSALYGLEVAFLAKQHMARLGKWQTRKLRFLSRSPAHVHHVCNADVRRRTGVPTVASTLLERRLVWWQGALSPAFPDLQKKPQDPLHEAQTQQDPDETPEGMKYVPTKLVRAVVFGRFNFEGGAQIQGDKLALGSPSRRSQTPLDDPFLRGPAGSQICP